MHQLTIGQIFVLFQGMAAYHKMTSPWGSGEQKASDAPVDATAAAFDAQNSGIFGVAPTAHISNLDPALQAIILDDSED